MKATGPYILSNRPYKYAQNKSIPRNLASLNKFFSHD